MASQNTEKPIVYEATNQEGQRERVFPAEGRREKIDSETKKSSKGEKHDDRRNPEDTVSSSNA